MTSKHISKNGKQLLKNTIKSVDFQNKKLEEKLMWKMHENKRSLNPNYNESSHKKIKIDHSSDDEIIDDSSTSKNYWIKKLVREEEKDSDRWGHNGFKELYPEEFEKESHSEPKEKKRKKSKSKKEKKKKKKHKKHKHKK